MLLLISLIFYSHYWMPFRQKFEKKIQEMLWIFLKLYTNLKEPNQIGWYDQVSIDS